MSDHQGGWARKFAAAFAGLTHAVKTQSSFAVHLPMAIAVIAVSAWLRIESWRWAMLIASISVVVSAELFNSSIEELVRVLHPGRDERIGRALDMAAAGVLVVSVGSVAIGLIALGSPLLNVVLGR